MFDRLPEVIDYLVSGSKLNFVDSLTLMEKIMEGKLTSSQISAILCALRMRGEDSEEIAGFASAMRERAIHFDLPPEMMVADNCGTGGDGKRTFNFSTASALIALAAGLKMVKHGNRSISSRCGSADFLEAMGIPVKIGPDKMKSLFDQTGFAFLFAPLYHPATGIVQPIRKELGIRTIFNLLGPLTNPAPVRYQLVGVYSKELLQPVAQALLRIGVQRAAVVWGEPGIDEISIVGESFLFLVEGNNISSRQIHPEEFGYPPGPLASIQGGEPKENVEIFWSILKNETKGPLRAALVLNTAFLLWVSEQSDSLSQAIEQTEELLTSGQALKKVQQLVRTSQQMVE
ncbi:MAG: anthranilate phosphoribosyltransferase [Candidatus Atribacteria bacterium]|nr:anthranilate phosphoribosyltransferase [Candidatus Atribacteria bacterium]